MVRLVEEQLIVLFSRQPQFLFLLVHLAFVVTIAEVLPPGLCHQLPDYLLTESHLVQMEQHVKAVGEGLEVVSGYKLIFVHVGVEANSHQELLVVGNFVVELIDIHAEVALEKL